MNKIVQLLLVTGFVFIGKTGFASGADTLYANITALQASDTINAYGNDPWFVILDVRTPSEFATQHLAEGVNIDYNSPTFAATLATLNKSKVYVLHCQSGGRSGIVFTMMQSLHFRRVYNMIGGLNSWSGSGLPATTSVAAAAGALCDTTVAFTDVTLNQRDSIQLTITNTANSILSFTGISGISGTEFSTNFNTGTTLPGARDYSFNVYYNPTDLIADNAVFYIQSNGGTIYFYLSGTALDPTGIDNTSIHPFPICTDPINHTISFRLKNENGFATISIIDLSGKIMYEQQENNSFVSIDYSTWKSNMYVLRIIENSVSATYKLPLIK